MDNLGAFIFMVVVVAAFVTGAILSSESHTYKLGQESVILIEQCELPLAREEFCELVAKPKGD